jgi:hypothetical protein
MAHEDPPTPPPPPTDETAPTGSWNLADLPLDDEPAPAGPPSVGILNTGAFKAPPKEEAPAPAGPPSVGILHTGSFYPPPSAEQRSIDPATLDATVIEAAPRPDALTPTPSNAPSDTIALRGGSTVDLPGPPTPPPPARVRTARPLEPMTPPPPADDDPALQATRPPSAPVGVLEEPSGGGWVWILIALVCLAGSVYLVRHAMPELFQRGKDGAAALTNPRPGVIAGRLETPPEKVDWRVLEGGVERARGTVAPRGDGAFELALDDLAEGTHQVTVELALPGGASLASQTLTVRVDRTAPVLRLLSPADAAAVTTGAVVALEVTDRSRVQVTCFVDDVIAWRESVDPLPGGAPARLERALAALGPGAHTIAINAVDETLRQSKVAHRVTVGPGVPVKPPPPAPPVVRLAWQDGAVAGPGTLEVAVEGAAEVKVLLDRQPFGALPVRLAAGAVTDGRHVIEVRATNAGGETRESRAFRFDGTPPALDGVSAPARGPSPVQLTGAVRDAVDPTPRLTLSVDGGPPAAVERLPHALDLAPGAHTLALVARDAAGNEARRALEVQVEPAGPVAPADTAGPEVTIVSPGGGPTYVSRERKVEVRVTDASGVAQVRLSLDNRVRRPERQDEQGAVVLRLDLADLPDGDHVLSIDASDVHGNETRTSRTWLLDTTPPAVTLVGPAPTSVSGAFDVAVNVRDAGRVAGVVIVVPGRGALPMPETSPGERRAKVELPPGDHEVVVRASDEAGNEGTLALRVSVQAAGPTLPPDPLPAEGPVVRFPARSLPRVVIDGALPAGARATIDSNGLRLATDVTSLPAEVTLPAGSQTVVVSVQLRTGRRQQFQGVVFVDATRPALDRVRIMARSTTVAEVTGTPQDDGPVTVEVLVNGAVHARALPCEVPLRPGLNEVVVVARDDVGNEARVSSKIDVTGGPATTTATPPPAVAPIDVVDSNDPREARALEALKAGRLDEAQRLVEQVIDAVRQGIRSPYVLRARISIARAAQVRGDVFKRDHLNAAEQDLTRAIINYGDAARSVHFKLRGDVLTELGRGRAAMLDYRRARDLERQGR